MTKTKIAPGTRYGRLTTVKEIEPHIQPSGRKRRRFLCACECGKQSKVLLLNLRSGDTRSCGCLNVEDKTSHGLRGNRFYARCAAAIKRCHDSNDASFEKYGGRGIKVFDPWKKDIAAFIRYIELLPGAGNHSLTIDRIDNDEGYIPGNLRLATYSTQNRNRRSRGSVPFRGVSHKRSGFVARISDSGKTRNLGTFSSQEEASKAYEEALAELDG